MSDPCKPLLKSFASSIVPESDVFRANYTANAEVCEKLQERLRDWHYEGKPKRVAAHREKGKLLGRERLELFLDQDSPFLEIMPLCGQGMKHMAKGNPLIGGVGVVSGIECMVVTYAPTVGTGSINKVTGMKWQRFMEVSRTNRLPFIMLLESGGADLRQAFDVFHGKPGAFWLLAKLSEARIPSMCVVFGNCIAGGAYFAGMSDYVIMVKDNATLALAGTRLVQVATGEVSTENELGGAAMHTTVSGSSEYMAANEQEACRKAREVLAAIAAPKPENKLFDGAFEDRGGDIEPLYDAEELLGVASADWRDGYDCREVIARIVDRSAFFEFKPDYGPTIVCCWAEIHGVPVGIVANNGVLFVPSAQKAAHFIRLSNERGVPLVYLHNVTGFIVGKHYEAEGMIKCGSMMINAMSNSVVPQLSILIGSSFGAANFAMCGRGYDPRFIFSWPLGKCAVMGPDQLSGVMELLARESYNKKGIDVDEQKVAMGKQMLQQRIEKEMDSFYYSAHGMDDGVIDPRDTRAVLGMCLSAIANEKVKSAPGMGIARL